MRYTCNKKAYPEFENDCKSCSEYDPCAKGGKWCFMAVASLPTYAKGGVMGNDGMFVRGDDCVEMIQPILRDTSTINIYIGDAEMQIGREELRKSLEREISVSLRVPRCVP